MNQSNSAAEKRASFASVRTSYVTRKSDGSTELISNRPGTELLSSVAFYSAVRFISETLAGLPKHLYRKTPQGRIRADHYLVGLVAEEPSAFANALYLWEAAIGHAVMYGDGYVWIRRDRYGNPVSLVNLHGCMVQPRQENGATWYYLRGVKEPLPYRDVIHIRNYSEDGREGISVIDTLAETLGIPLRLDEFLSKYFEQGQMINLVVESTTNGTQEDVDTIQHGIAQNNSGLANAHNPMVLFNATAKNLTSALKDFALDVLKSATVDDVARATRVPPHVLYALGRATWSNTEQLGTELVQYSFASWVAKIELELKLKLLTPYERKEGYYWKWNLDGLQRGDFTTRRNTLRADYLAGLISFEQWLEIEDMEYDEDGTYFAPLHLGSDAPQGEAPAAAQIAAPTEPAAPAVETPAAEPAPAKPIDEAYGRILAATAERVKTKQLKAFAKKDPNADGYSDWLARFAGEQGLYLGEQLNPFLETVVGDAVDIAFLLQDAVEGYSADVLKRGSEAEPSEAIEMVVRKIEAKNGKN